MTTLGDAPGGAQFIDSLVGAIQMLALLYANTPDTSALPHLESYIDAIEPGISDAVGAEKATIILSTLRRAVMCRKHTLESGGASRA